MKQRHGLRLITLCAIAITVALAPLAPAIGAVTIAAEAAQPGDTPIRVLLDGHELAFDVAPFMRDDRVLVPIRAIAEALCFTVGWDEAAGMVEILAAEGAGSGKSMRLYLGSKTAYVNQSRVTLDVPAVEIDGRTFVPLRFVSENLGATVEWKEGRNTVVITSAASLAAQAADAADEDNTAIPAPGQWERYPMLANRFTIQLPKGAETLQRGVNGIMGYGASELVETHYYFKRGDGAVIVSMRELWLTGSGKLQDDLYKLLVYDAGLSRGNVTVGDVHKSGKLSSVWFTVNEGATVDIGGAKVAMVANGLVKDADGYLTSVAVYASLDALADGYEQGTLQIADKAIKSIKAGNRGMNTAERDVTAEGVSLHLDQGYTYYVEYGYDYWLTSIVKPVPVGASPAVCTLYFGNFPSFTSADLPVAGADDILGGTAEWRRVDPQGDGEAAEAAETAETGDGNGAGAAIGAGTRFETLASTGYSYPAWLHVFAYPRTEDDWESIRGMLRSMRIEPPVVEEETNTGKQIVPLSAAEDGVSFNGGGAMTGRMMPETMGWLMPAWR